jgi:hypothetical protein
LGQLNDFRLTWACVPSSPFPVAAVHEHRALSGNRVIAEAIQNTLLFCFFFIAFWQSEQDSAGLFCGHGELLEAAPAFERNMWNSEVCQRRM